MCLQLIGKNVVNEGLRTLFFAIVTTTAFWNAMPNIFVVYDERFEMKHLRQYLSAVLDMHFHGIETGSPCPPQSPLAVAIIPYPHHMAQNVQMGSGAHEASYYILGYRGRRREIRRGKTCQVVKFTTHLHSLLMLTMSEAVPSLPYMLVSNTY
jgi:hypothetical protein